MIGTQKIIYETKTSEIKSCNEFTLDCESSLFGCQLSDNKCSSATECAQLLLNVC